VQAPAVGTQDAHLQIVYVDLLAAFRQTAEAIDDQPADRIELAVLERGAEHGVEVGDLGQRLDPVMAGLVENDVVFGFIEIVLVLDLADDLLDDVFDGEQAATPPYSSTTIAM